MSEKTGSSIDDEDREALARAFGRTMDPLAEFTSPFEALDVDPFELFLTEVLAEQNVAEDTWQSYERLIGQWREHMGREGRHPACPNDQNVTAFVDYCVTDRDNQPDTARTKLRRLQSIYEYWQDDPVFPHPQTYDPFGFALSKLNLERPPVKEPPRIPIAELGEIIRSMSHIRDRTIVVAQLKLGLRAMELCNLKLAEVSLDNPELERGYPELGSHEVLAGRPNAVFIPSRHERTGNKSRRPRTLPLDEELQSLFYQHLLTRPDSGNEWVFQTKSTHNELDQEYVNRIWTEAFQPAYAETERHRGVTSHFGRHRFTTYWQVDREINRELVKYMRGDTIEGEEISREAIDDYVHAYYEDVEACYREQIFELDVTPQSAIAVGSTSSEGGTLRVPKRIERRSNRHRRDASNVRGRFLRQCVASFTRGSIQTCCRDAAWVLAGGDIPVCGLDGQLVSALFYFLR